MSCAATFRLTPSALPIGLQAKMDQAVTARTGAATAAAAATTASQRSALEAASAKAADQSAQQKQRYEALQRSADEAAAAAAASRPSSSAVGQDMAAARGAGVAAVQRSGMVPLSVAQEAEQRRQQWTQLGGGSTESLARLARESERAAQVRMPTFHACCNCYRKFLFKSVPLLSFWEGTQGALFRSTCTWQ